MVSWAAGEVSTSQRAVHGGPRSPVAPDFSVSLMLERVLVPVGVVADAFDARALSVDDAWRGQRKDAL